MELWKLLIEQVGTPIVILGAVAFLIQQSIAQWMARDIKRFEHKREVDLEQFKKDLDASQFERQARFTSLHEKRAEVIAKLYEQLAEASQAIREMTSPMQFTTKDTVEDDKRKAAQRSKAVDAYNSTRAYFETHRLYLGTAVAAKVDALLNLAHGALLEFELSQGRFGGVIDHKQWLAAWEKVSKEMPSVLSEVEQQFHKILGVTD